MNKVFSPSRQVRAVASKAQQRLVARQFVAAAPWWISGGAAFGGLWILASHAPQNGQWMLGLSQLTAMGQGLVVGGCAAVACLAGAAVAWLRRPTLEQSLHAVDRSLGLNDQLLTSAYAGDAGPLGVLAQGVGNRLAEQVKVGQAIPFMEKDRAPAVRAWSVAGLVLAGGLCAQLVPVGWMGNVRGWIEQSTVAVRAIDAQQAKETVDAAAAVIETLKRSELGEGNLRQDAADSARTNERTARAAAAIREIEQELANGKADPRRAVDQVASKLNDAAEALESNARNAELASQRLRDQLAGLGANAPIGSSELGGSEGGKDSEPGHSEGAGEDAMAAFERALARGDLKEAVAQTESLARAVNSMNAEERKQLARQLEQLASELEKAQKQETTRASESESLGEQIDQKSSPASASAQNASGKNEQTRMDEQRSTDQRSEEPSRDLGKELANSMRDASAELRKDDAAKVEPSERSQPTESLANPQNPQTPESPKSTESPAGAAADGAKRERLGDEKNRESREPRRDERGSREDAGTQERASADRRQEDLKPSPSQESGADERKNLQQQGDVSSKSPASNDQSATPNPGTGAGTKERSSPDSGAGKDGAASEKTDQRNHQKTGEKSDTKAQEKDQSNEQGKQTERKAQGSREGGAEAQQSGEKSDDQKAKEAGTSADGNSGEQEQGSGTQRSGKQEESSSAKEQAQERANRNGKTDGGVRSTEAEPQGDQQSQERGNAKQSATGKELSESQRKDSGASDELPSTLPDAEKIREIGKRLREMEQLPERAKEQMGDSQKLREQAQNLLEGASPEQREELMKLARDLAKRQNPATKDGNQQNQRTQGSTDGAREEQDGLSRESSSAPNLAGPARKGDGQAREIGGAGGAGGEDVGLGKTSESGKQAQKSQQSAERAGQRLSSRSGDRDKDAEQEQDPGSVIARWVSDRRSQGGASSATSTAGDVSQALEQASKSAERAIEQRVVPNRASGLIRKYFSRLPEELGVSPSNGSGTPTGAGGNPGSGGGTTGGTSGGNKQ